MSLQLIGGLVSGYESAWTAYTPNVTSGTGTFTSVAASGRYKQNGKTVHFTVNVTITTNGTAAGSVVVGLPVTAFGNGVFCGRENGLTGFGLSVTIASSTTLLIQKYDATYLGGNGAILAVSGTYDAA
jgi:hypothetical protein